MIHVIDTHCHLTGERFAGDRSAVINGLRQAGIWRAITIGTGIEDAQAVRDLVALHPDILAGAAGLDTHSAWEAAADYPGQLAELDRLLASGAFCALGEIGLEYHHQLAPWAEQHTQVSTQFELALRHDLPVVLHVRDGAAAGGRGAQEDMIELLRQHPRNRGVIHSFAGTPDHARRYLDLGWHLSFNGMLTYKGNDALRQAAALVPADRLLIETDAPYLPPIPHRGRRCVPDMVNVTAALLADLRGEREDDIRAWTTRNACRLFKLTLPPEWTASENN
jgi:TatD DNase family protein